MTGSSPAGPGAARYERVGAAAVIAIRRPQRRNAIDGPTAEAMVQAVRAFNDDPDARVPVVTGDEEAFCAGADLTSLESLRPRVGKPEGVFGVRRFPPKPAIAAISGWCLGGGVTLATWCDLRIAADTARFGFPDRQWGVPILDRGADRLAAIIGLGRALDLVLTGREISAATALAMGLVTEVVAPGEHVTRAGNRRTHRELPAGHAAGRPMGTARRARPADGVHRAARRAHAERGGWRRGAGVGAIHLWRSGRLTAQ